MSEQSGLFSIKTGHIYLRYCLRNTNNSNSKTYLLIFLSIIEDIHVLLITGLSYSFTLSFSRYSTFVCDSLYIFYHVHYT